MQEGIASPKTENMSEDEIDRSRATWKQISETVF